MKKLTSTLLLLCILLGAVACARGEPMQGTSPAQTELPQLVIDVYPVNAESYFPLEEIQPPVDTMYLTPASENGLEGTMCKIEGTVTSSDASVILIDTAHGTVMVYNSVEEVLATMPDADEEKLWSYYPAPQVGDRVIFYAEYSGFSGVYDCAAFIYGSEGYLTTALEDAMPTSTEPTPETKISEPAPATFGNLVFANAEGYPITFSDNTYTVELDKEKTTVLIQVTDAHNFSDLERQMLQEMLMEKMISPLDPRTDEQVLGDDVAGFDATGTSFYCTSDSGAAIFCTNFSFTDGYYTYNVVLLCDGNVDVVADHLEQFQKFLDALEYPDNDGIPSDQSNDATRPANYAEDKLGTKENPYSAGAYKVGVDVPAGEYIFVCTGNSPAYFCASADSNQDDIIENENFESYFFATVEDGQYLTTKRCVFINADDYTLTVDKANLGSGTYRVGVDIPAGEYRLTAEGNYSGYYCVYADSIMPFDIEANDNFDSSAYVTVNDGQYLKLSRCSASIIE